MGELETVVTWAMVAWLWISAIIVFCVSVDHLHAISVDCDLHENDPSDRRYTWKDTAFHIGGLALSIMLFVLGVMIIYDWMFIW